MPKVSVIMAVYNGALYVRTAINSILSQSLTDFELIVVDDASTDETSSILKSYTDNRLIILRNSENLGFARSLNRALARASGDYVARMDADDISISCRFEKQVNFLDTHPEIGLLGSAYYRMVLSGRRLGGPVRKPESDAEIRWAILLENPFCHPSVMVRRQVLVTYDLGYDPEFTTTQDYELWVRVLEHCEGANLRDPLLLYRFHGKSVSWSRREVQQRNSVLVSRKAIRNILPQVRITVETIRLLQKGLFGHDQFLFLPGADRGILAKAYMELFYSFEKVFGGEKIESVRRTAALFSSYIVLHFPLQSGWFAYIKKAKQLYPQLVWEYPGFALNMFVRKVGRWILVGRKRGSLQVTVN